MEHPQIPVKRYTVRALLLQTGVLFGLLALSFYDEMRSSDGLVSLSLGVLCAVAIWLTGNHYWGIVRRRRLQMWAVFCIALSVYPSVPSFGRYIAYPSFVSLVSLLPVLMFIVSTSFVLIFSSMESP